MTIKIVYFKSSSKYYDTVCLQCEAFDSYTQKKSENILTLDLDDLRQERSKIRGILEIIKNWTKTEYYINDAKVSMLCMESLIEIFDCEKLCHECVIADEHCYDGAGWGCKFISSVALRRKSYYSYNLKLYPKFYWYEFGHFVDGEWVIDKDRILAQLKDEVTEKHTDICEYFALVRLENALNALPEKIVVIDNDDCEWEYKYREAPLGMTQTEIIGIRPREKHSSGFGGGFGISISTAFNGENKNSQQEAVKKNVPTITFRAIGGIDDIVQQVREIIELPLIVPSIFEHYHIKPHKGVLLYGPPGCGKTLIAKAVANEINAHFIAVSGPEILNRYVGQSEANLRNIFEEAKINCPTVIYFDEFDSISSTRDAEGNPLMATVVNQLLTLMDGIEESSQICAIASTNRIDMIDEAVKRPGRFDYVIEIQRPSPEGCKAIFRIHTEKMPIDESFDKEVFVDRYLTGCSGAEIAFVASEAAYNSIRRTINISQIFMQDYEFTISKENTILECDFIKAAKSLKDNRKRADTAKFRYNL